MRYASRFFLMAVLLALGVLAVWSQAPAKPTGVAVSYQLPTTGPLPHTYRVTVAITDPKNPKWIIDTVVAGGVRTVTAANMGKFTDYWDGLDDNGMPVPPGSYGVKGIVMPASTWKMDGQPHTLTAKYLLGAGDSWSASPQQDDKVSWIFGHCFGGLNDVQVGPNGTGGFLFSYIENAWNPFLADLNKPIGYDQVLRSFNSGGTAGGSTTACDGEFLWFLGSGGKPFIHRAGGGWGSAKNEYGVQGMPIPIESPSMVAWKDPADVARYLYVALPGTINMVAVYDGNNAKKLGETALTNPQALMLDRAHPGTRLLALHQDAKGAWLVSAMALHQGLPDGTWTPVFTLQGIANPMDCDIDSQGRFYVSDSSANQVYQLDATGAVLRRFGKGTQSAGKYNPQALMTPTKLALWTDLKGQDRLLIIEHGGPSRLSEWSTDGLLIRQWFFPEPGAMGYCMDPDNPRDIYIVGVYGGLVRFKVDYDKATWTPDAVWPDLCQKGMYPRIYNLKGQRYLTFPGGTQSDQFYMIYREENGNWLPSAGIITQNKVRYWWHDSNGDGEVQDDEFTGKVEKLRGQYWADQWLPDLSLTNFLGDGTWQRVAPTGFDAHNNPIFDDTKWSIFLSDPVYAGLRAGNLDALHGGNEIPATGVNWIHLDGNMQDGFYVADAFGPRNPGGVDTAGSYFSQNKLTRYVPDGKGGFTAQWRVGRKAWRLANPGEIYGIHHFTGETYGMVGIFDSNGLYHVYTNEGFYVDTLLMDTFRSSIPKSGMYGYSGESWYGVHYLNRENGKVYLYSGRSACTVYEVEGWGKNITSPLAVLTPNVTITAAEIAPANEYALAVRGGAGKAHVAQFYPAPGGGPAIDGSMAGWESCPPVTFGLDATHQVEARVLYDPQTLYLRWHVRLPATFTPKPLGDPVRLFTHDRLSDFVSFYYQGNPAAPASRDDGRPDDVRLTFAVVQDGAVVKPVVLGMYPSWNGAGGANPVTYVSPVGKAVFAHVGLLGTAKLAHTIDADGKGYVISAAIPRDAIPSRGPFAGGVRTTVDFAATFGGKTNCWWANTGGATNSLTTDEPSEARLFPGAWAQAQFIDIGQLPIRIWSAIGPFGFAKLPQLDVLAGRTEISRTLVATKYPPEQVIDLTASYTGELTQTRDALHIAKWKTVSTAGDRINFTDAIGWRAGNNEGTAYALTYIYTPAPVPVKFVVLDDHGHHGVSGWLNDRPLPTTGNVSTKSDGTIDTNKPFALNAGWNKVLLRYDYIWGSQQLGLAIDATPDVLWNLRFSATPPKP